MKLRPWGLFTEVTLTRPLGLAGTRSLYQQVLVRADLLCADRSSALSSVLSAEGEQGTYQAKVLWSEHLRNHVHKSESDFLTCYPLDFSQFVKKWETLRLEKPEALMEGALLTVNS